MILKFPNLDTLRLALTSGAVPPAVSQAAAVAGFDDQEQIWVETPASLSRSSQNDLRKLGVQVVRNLGSTLTAEVSCWPELVPLVPNPAPLERPEQAVVLFDLPDGAALARLASEILRLGNDRQTFRWLEETGKNVNGAGRALLRVVGPPYYSLLRALDHRDQKTAPVAYVEQSKGVWVEMGYVHPFGANVRPPAGKILLLRPPRQWQLLDDGEFRDLYEVMEFTLPDGPSRWQDGQLTARLHVTPTLKPGGSPDGAELWVLRHDPVAELNRFVQNADDQLLNRLAFAVGEKDGQTTIVLRVRQSKLPPPVLVLDAESYHHGFAKLPNLFVPVGTRLHPPLRRDVVRKLLADDPSQVTWLAPGDNGHFRPESLPEDAFRPLWDWVDYVLDHDKEALQAWVQAAQFDFEPFVCADDEAARPRKPPSSERERSRSGRTSSTASGGEAGEPAVSYTDQAEADEEKRSDLDPFADVVRVEPSEVQRQLQALEDRFLSLEGGLDVPERQEMWPELAGLNAAINRTDEAGVCWLNALWEKDGPTPAWAWTWFRTEAAAVPTRPEVRGRSWAARVTTADKGREIGGDELDRLLNLPEPAVADVRALAAYLVWAAQRNPPPAPLLERLPRVQRFLETHERIIPVRAVWLAWYHLVQLSRGDVLALARARDRLLERLFHNGLRPEQDLPSFLRFAGQPTSQRFRAVRQWMTDLNGQAQGWLKENGPAVQATAQTPAYIDLIFAFGLARLGEQDAAREALNRAEAVLASRDDAHQFLLRAFRYRITRSLEGQAHTGPLPAEELELLEAMERLPHYVVDRLRKHSRILEPEQKIDPYRHWGARISDFERAIAELTDVADAQEVVSRIDRLLKEVPKGGKGAEQRARVLKAALEAAPRVGEDFARRTLEQTVPAYDALPEAKELAALMEQSAFLEKALFVAAHFDRLEYIHPLVARFQKMLQTQRGPQAVQALDSLAGQCFRGLRKLGMRDEIDQLLTLMANMILEGQPLEAVDFKKMPQGVYALKALLHVAAGWYYFGRDRQAEPVLQAARAILLHGELHPRDQTQLACSYALTVGQAPVEVAQKRLEEVFQAVRNVRDTFTTSSHFSVSQLDVVEAVVLAVVSDDFTLGTQARRWLDDDEFLVRRRLHRDMREMQKHA